ncbi:MAG: TrmH family RNA methyltransferase [Firmicutes bacterium]|nr:TrmH family RNA methyltransferase [Bacillota bacterium]
MAEKISRYKHDLPISYTLGATLTYEAFKLRPELLEKVYISSETQIDGGIQELIENLKAAGIPVLRNDKAFHILSPKGNCYVIGQFQKERKKLSGGNHLVLVNPSDAGNLGTIIRTAAGFGFEDLAIVSPAVDVFDPKVVRASMGALFHLRIEYFDAIEDYIKRFPDNNRYAFMLRVPTPLPKVPIQKPYSLIFGNEATGLPESYADFCQSVIIRHTNSIDSLNLPMAAGIAMYEFTKEAFNNYN